MDNIQDWLNYDLNDGILSNISRLGFSSPTDIQKKVLVYCNSKVDLLIQARTGEGKTLCYGIPIVNYILNLYEKAENLVKQISPVALILVPTRELGIQVKDHISEILKDVGIEADSTGSKDKSYHNIKIAKVLGGFAKPAQLKVLNKWNPEIIIATPGRLWEIIENDEASILGKIYRLKFLVLDEADRMTEKGHFRELRQILDYVYTKIESGNKDDDEATGKTRNKIDKISKNIDVEEDNEENRKILKTLKKKNLVADGDIETIDPMQFLNDEDFDDMNLDMKENEEEEGEENEEENEGEEIEGDENEEQEEEEAEEEAQDDILDFHKLHKIKKSENKMTQIENPKHSINLRTILCSATIEQLHKSEKDQKQKGQKGKSKQKNEDINNLESLIKNLKFFNKLIYLRQNLKKQEGETDEDLDLKSFILPERLEIDCYKCDTQLKDYYLFHLLKENENKKVIVFTNSISHTKKIYSIFSYFDFKMVCLHSKMQQSQRIKNLDKFRNGQVNFLFCTDVGARGLDIPLVDLVIHYHIPMKTELFIHRSGRTARALKSGHSTSLISEKELNLYKKIMKDLKLKEFTMKTLSTGQVEKYKSLFEYTKKVEREEYTDKKKNREKQWLNKMARDCEMILDDEGSEDDDGGDEKMLSKKRKRVNKEKINSKKIYHTINANDIKRTSFLTPDMIAKLNGLMNDDKMKGLNLTQAIYEAQSDAEAIRYKGKQKKKRYQRRRKNK
jgi:ATP-dependent RNA helicase DDX24/MAK5